MTDIFSKEKIDEYTEGMSEEEKRWYEETMADIEKTVESQIRYEEPQIVKSENNQSNLSDCLKQLQEESRREFEALNSKNKHKEAGDTFTYIFYSPLKSIVTILKGIFEVLRVLSIPAFFGGCFCLFKYFSEHPKEWYYQLWFGIALVVSPFVVNAIYFILCQIKVKLMMRLATNKHVINRIDSL